MREIAAASDFDFVALEPRRADKGATRQRAKGQKKETPATRSRFAALWRYRTPALGVLLLSGLLVAIVINAMFLQHGRHPAPLFGATFRIAPPAPPTPPVRPASLDALLKDDLPQPALQPVSPAQDAAFAAPANDGPPASAFPDAAPQAAPATKSRDAIGALIADNGVVTPSIAAMSGAKPVRNSEAKAESKSVLSAQRALAKMGAQVKPDGAFGASTRKAVEAFQRQNHLQATGELDARTRHLLSARSGLRVE